MRGQLPLANGVIVREIRPIDLKRALDVLTQSGDLSTEDVENTVFQTVLLSNSDLLDSKNALTVEDVEAFLKFNEAFFSGGGSGEPRTLKQILDDLNNACAVLIHHGHVHCSDYGWAFFQAAQELYREED